MPRQMTRTSHRLQLGADPSPVQYGLHPAGAQEIPLDVLYNMGQPGRLTVSHQLRPIPGASRVMRLDIPFAKPADRKLQAEARGPVRPLLYGARRRLTEAQGRFAPVPRHVGGRFVQFL